MAESATHALLVRAIATYLECEIKAGLEMAILVASPSSNASSLPPVIGGRIPDVYARQNAPEVVWIGEAKTAGDIETTRSRQQYSDYLSHLATFTSGTLVLAVPWHTVPQTRSLLAHLQKRTGTQKVKLVVLERLPG